MAQISWAFQHRVRKRQPEGGDCGLGTSPSRTMCLRARSGSGVGDGHGREERLRVGVGRPLVDVRAVADLDDLAQVHDGDPVRDVPHHGQVVRNEEEGDAELVLQVVEQVDDAGLNRHVEGGDRLVEDQQLGLEHEGPGDADALALAARELVGVAVGVVRLEAHQLEHLGDPLPAWPSRSPTPWICSGSAMA